MLAVFIASAYIHTRAHCHVLTDIDDRDPLSLNMTFEKVFAVEGPLAVGNFTHKLWGFVAKLVPSQMLGPGEVLIFPVQVRDKEIDKTSRSKNTLWQTSQK